MLSESEEPAPQLPVVVAPLPIPISATGAPHLNTGRAIGGIVLLVSLSGLAIRIVPRFEDRAPDTDTVPVATQHQPAADPSAFQKTPAPFLSNPFGTPGPANVGAVSPVLTTNPTPTSKAAIVKTGDPTSALLNAALAQQKAGKLPQAIATYEDVLKQKPLLMTPRLSLATLYAATRQWDKALAQMQTARHLDPKNADVTAAIAQIRMGQGKPRDAIEPATATVRLAPAQPRAWSLLGQTYLANGKPADAFRAFSRGSDIAPTEAAIAFAAGATALDQLGKPGMAEKYLRRAATLETHDVRGPLYLGRALAAQHKFATAEKVLQDGTKHFAGSPDLLATLAEVRADSGDRSGSAGAWRSAIAAVPENVGGGVPAARMNIELGKQLIADKKYSDAMIPLRNATRLLPKEEAPSDLLVLAAVHAGNDKAVINELRRSLKVDPTRDNARRTLGHYLAVWGDMAGAQRELTQYAARHPRDIDTLATLASIDETCKQYDKALSIWRKIDVYVPDKTAPHMQTARILEKMGRDSDAVEKYRYVLQIDPTDPQALWGAAQIEDKMKEPARAMAHLRDLVTAHSDFVPAYEPLLRDSAGTQQLPATLNMLRQLLDHNPEQIAPCRAVLDYYRKSDREKGRAWVKAVIDAHPKALAPRRAIDEFDLAHAQQLLSDLRKKPVAPETDSSTGIKPSPQASPPARPTIAPKSTAQAASTPKPTSTAKSPGVTSGSASPKAPQPAAARPTTP